MSDLTKTRQDYLDAMGIDIWVRRSRQPPPIESLPLRTEAEPATPTMAVAVAPAELGQCGWDELQRLVSGCRNCALAQQRTQTVFGVGSRQADWLFVGEAPGAEEDRRGEPFVGRAGKLLDAMLLALDLRRDQVYIANTVKCRPPDNRNPKAEELQACNPYLDRQITLLKPKLIVALGGIAAKHLLQTERRVGELRGEVFHYGVSNIPLLVTYHPAYLLRSPQDKAKTWADLRAAGALYNRLPRVQ